MEGKHMRFKSTLPVAACLCVLLMAGALAAQIITGNIFGTVRDESGGVLPGASVTITSPALPSGPSTMVTNEKGQFRFPNLAPGVYGLEVSITGFGEYKEEGLRVTVGGSTERNLAMKISSVSETVTVTGESPIVDTKKTGVSANFSEEVVQNTPVRRFSMFDFLKWSPGISATSPSSGGTMSMTAFGSSTNDNVFLMDGTDFTAPVSGNAWPYPDTDVIQEVETVALGASAEYGNVQGAVFNVVTRQGGNDYRFDFSAFAQPDWLTSAPIKVDCGGCSAGPETGFTRNRYRDMTVHAAGPVIKDKLWFFGGYQYQRDYDNQPGTDPEFPRLWEADRMFWKVNWQITPNLKFMNTYHDDFWAIPATPSVADPFATDLSYGGHNPSTTVADLTQVVSSNTYWDARFSGLVSPNDYSRANNPDLTQAWHRDLDTGLASGGSYGDGAFTQSRWAFHAKLSHYATDFLGSDHDFKFGVQFVRGQSRQFYLYPGGAHYYDYSQSGNTPYAYFRAPYTYGGKFKDLGVFAEDVVRPNDRLTLSLGVRFDRNQAISPDIPAYDAVGNELSSNIKGLGNLFTWTNVSPRLGFNVKLTEDGRTLLRGNYGRFVQGIIAGEISTVHPGISPITLAYFDPATGGYTDIASVTDPVANLRVDPNTKAPHTDQFSLGFDREVARNLGIGATYVYKKGTDYTGYTDIVGEYGTDTATLPDGRTITVHPLLSEPDARIFEFTNPSGYFTKYNGLLLTFNKRMSDHWQANISYTLSKAEGLIVSNGRAPNISQGSAAFAGSSAKFGRDPNDLINATGNLLNDRTHMVRVQTAYEIPGPEILVGAAFQYLTGKPYAPQANVRLPQGTRQIYIEPLGSYRLSAQTLLDLRISKIFRFSNERRIEVLVDILNLLQDKAEESIVSRNFFSDNYGVPNTYIDPRRAMIGVKFHF
jgi:outer membrane receptor protein involved in Fe transport